MTKTKMREISFAEKVPIFRALGLFVLVSTLIIAIISFMRHRLRVDFSISRYVGLEFWSVILFAMANIVAASWIGRYLYEIGQLWRMPRVYYWLVIGVAVTLIGLSICPLGYFDRYAGMGGASIVHQITSRMMFIFMALVVLTIICNRYVGWQTRVVGVIFLCYMVICMIGHFLDLEWFSGHFLIFEALYLISFMVFCAFCQTKSGIKLDKR